MFIKQKMKQIIINSTNELLEFIKRDEVTAEQGTKIVCKALNIISISKFNKEELIQQTEYFINTFFKNDNLERPLFLDKLDLEVNIKDI